MALLDNIRVFYNLAEASGNALDSVGSNNLTDNNGVGTAAGIGGSGAARNFNGTNQFLSLTSNATVQTGDIDFSVQAWVYWDVVGGILVGKDIDSPANSRDYVLDVTGPSARFYINGGGGGLIVNSGVTMSTGNWYHVCGGHSATSNLVWVAVNDETAVTATTSGTVPESSASSPFQVGARAYSGFEGFSDARIQYVGLWARDIRNGVAASGSDVTALYASGAGLSYAGMGGGSGNRRRRLLICG
jgi:hypothetical protein